MAYLYTKFGAAYASAEALPYLDGSEPQGAGEIPEQLMQLPGGNAWDPLGSDTARPRSRIITLIGDWVADSVADMEQKIDALNALAGKRSYLWRTNDGGTTLRKRLARCLDVRAPAESGSGMVATIEMDFELAPGLWEGTEHSETTILDASPHNIVTTNGGNARVRDAILTVTASGSAITQISVYKSDVLHWHYSGSIAAGQALVVDCGSKRVRNNGADDYAHFALQAGHADNDWLPIEVGANTFVIERSGGDNASTSKLEYADGWM